MSAKSLEAGLPEDRLKGLSGYMGWTVDRIRPGSGYPMSDQKRWFKRFPGKGLSGDKIVDQRRRQRAYDAVKIAILIGELKVKSVCQDCGSRSNIIKHHDDYGKPLDIIELCPSCHSKRHGRFEEYKGE